MIAGFVRLPGLLGASKIQPFLVDIMVTIHTHAAVVTIRTHAGVVTTVITGARTGMARDTAQMAGPTAMMIAAAVILTVTGIGVTIIGINGTVTGIMGDVIVTGISM